MSSTNNANMQSESRKFVADYFCQFQKWPLSAKINLNG